MASPRFGAARSGLLAALALIAWLALTATAGAATFTPTTGADYPDFDLSDQECNADTDGDNLKDGVCTLRAAVQEAGMDPGADTIDLPARTYKIELNGDDDNGKVGDFDIQQNGGDLTINGAGKRTTIINADGYDRVFDIGVLFGEALPAETGPKVVINGVMIRNGFTGQDPEFEFETAKTTGEALAVADVGGFDFYYSGGGLRIAEGAAVTVNDSSVSFNRAGAKDTFCECGLGLLEPSAFGIGGGIANAGDLTLNRTVVQRNVTDILGGGIANAGTLTVNDSAIDENVVSVVGGGILNAGPMTIDQSTVSGNLSGAVGGGIVNLTPPPEEEPPALFEGQTGAEGDATSNTITNSTVNDNLARLFAGGAILTGGGQLDLVNDTISNNQMASADLFSLLLGPGVEFPVIGSDGVGAGLFALGPVTVKNTILATNTTDGITDDCFDASNEGDLVTSLGHNIVSDEFADQYCGDFNAEKGDQIGVDPLLEEPHENGGPTRTMALRTGSAALDAALDCPAVDQRGGHRPPVAGSAGSACDVGAYEAYSLGDLSVAANVAGGDPTQVGGKLTYTLVVTNDGPDEARGVNLADALPGGVTFLGASNGCSQVGQSVSCDLGSILPNQVKIVRVDVRPNAPGTVVDTATISAAGYNDTNPGNDSASVQSDVIAAPVIPAQPNEPGKSLPPLKLKLDAPDTISVQDFLDGFLVEAHCVGEDCKRNFRSHVKIKTGEAQIAAYNLTVARVSVGSKYRGSVRLRPCVTGTNPKSARHPSRSCLRKLSNRVAKYAPFKVKVVVAGYKRDGRVAYRKHTVRVRG